MKSKFSEFNPKKINQPIMKLLNRYLILLLMAVVSLSMITACSDDDNGIVTPDPEPEPGEPNLVELAQSDENFSTLVSLVVDLDLVDVLANEELTVFAPTNAAFEAISDIIPNLSNEDLAEIVTYHLVAGTVLSSDLGAQQDVEMVQGERTLIQASAAGVRINNRADVVEADLVASNGVIHAIDTVILPTQYRVAIEGPSLVEVAQEAGAFNTLLNLTETVGLTTTLQFLGPYTAFAPTDEAFDTLFESVDPASLTGEQIAFILTYHVLAGAEVTSDMLEPTQTVETAATEPIYITADDAGVRVNGSSNVVTPDVDAANGVIHVVDQVLLPNAFTPVTGVIAKNYMLSTLLAVAAERPAIVEALSDPTAELTVFAPTNEAFEAALAAFPDLTDDQITEILTYHVLASAVFSSDLSDGATVETLQGEEIVVSLGDEVLINDSEVIVVDLAGSNGVVHIIDAVLVPPSFLE